MQTFSRKRSATSVLLRFKILDLSAAATNTGDGKTGLAFNTASLVISTITNNEATAVTYDVTGSTIEDITTLGTYAAPTATKCRFKEVDSTNHPGLYELHLADARFAVAGACELHVVVKGSADTRETHLHVNLSAVDPHDSVRGGMTALPNAAADAAGGLPISDAGGLDLDAKVGALTFTVANQVDANALAISGDTAAADNLESAYDGTGYGSVMVRTTIATLATQVSFTLTAGSADNDAYNGCVIVIQDASTAAQKATAVISDYVGATKTVTLLNDPGIFTMAANDVVTIVADEALHPAADNARLTTTGIVGLSPWR